MSNHSSFRLSPRWLGNCALVLSVLLTIGGCTRGRTETSSELPELEATLVLGAQEEGTSEADRTAFLYYPSSVALDGKGQIYVLDTANFRVAVFSASGGFLRSFGRAGQGPGEFTLGPDHFSDLAISGDRLAVLDRTAQRVQILSLEGEFQASLTVFQVPTSVALVDNRLYLAAAGKDPESPKDVVVYTIEDEELLRSPTVLSAPLVKPSHPDGDWLNMGHVAVAPNREIRQAFLFWPLIRSSEQSGGMSEQWLDFAWLGPSSQRRSQYWRPQSPNDPDLSFADVKGVVFYDLEYVNAGGEDLWVGLLEGGVIQAWSTTGEPLKAYQTLPAGPPAGPNELVAPVLVDIGVDANGTRVCGADFEGAVVRCYEVPKWRD